jgi:solute carrier family 25 carnitine/acylcarnitine transporter 20/29
MVAGALAGMVAWALVFPADIVKSKIQALPANAAPEERSALFQLQRGVSQEGWRFFKRGFVACMARACVGNMAIFSAYEGTMNILQTTC